MRRTARPTPLFPTARDPTRGLPTPVPPALLEVSLTGARSTDGDVCVAVFDTEAAYEGDGSASVFRGCVPFADQPLRVPGLVDGKTFAVSAFADVNRNAKLDTRSVFGVDVPAEGHAFSNDPPQGFGAPSWSQVKFTFSAATRAFVLTVRYI